jgi:hypothetical protein
MAAIPDVNPGDLISAQLMNQILHKIADLEGKIGTGTTGTVPVPSLFGLTLGSARAILIAPTTQLAVGGVLDTGGVVINPTAPSTANRLVLMQSPMAGERVAAGSSVDLVVVGTGSGAIPTPAPAITSITQATAPMNTAITINGTNFATLFSSNVVTFDGAQGTVNPGNDPTRLSVVVPTTIPGAPKSGVQVVVTVAGVASNASPINVTAAQVNQPTITDMNPVGAQEGTAVTITGTNFGAAPANNEVRFDGQLGIVNSGGSTSLNVTVPTTVVASTPKFDVQLTVKNLTTGATSLPRTVIITPQ